jgi:hypothetical protein
MNGPLGRQQLAGLTVFLVVAFPTPDKFNL